MLDKIKFIPYKGIEIEGKLIELGSSMEDNKDINGTLPDTVLGFVKAFFNYTVFLEYFEEKLKCIRIKFIEDVTKEEVISKIEETISDIDFVESVPNVYFENNYGIMISLKENGMCDYVTLDKFLMLKLKLPKIEKEYLEQNKGFNEDIIKYPDELNVNREEKTISIPDVEITIPTTADDIMYSEELDDFEHENNEDDEVLDYKKTQMFIDETKIKSIEQLRKDFEYLKLEAFFDKYKDRVQNVIRYKYKGLADEDNIPVGNTKFGGRPDLPVDMKWPKDEVTNESCSFIAQLNFEELKKFDTNNILPDKGMLYFFLRQTLDKEFGEDSWCKIIDASAVSMIIYVENIENLERKEVPDDFKNIELKLYDCIDFEIDNYFEFPFKSYFTEEEIEETFDEIYKNEEEKEKHKEVALRFLRKFEALTLLDSERYKTLGLPENFQSSCSMEEEDVLLLQFDSATNTNINFGDCGRLFFYINKEDLKNKRFYKVKNTFISY